MKKFLVGLVIVVALLAGIGGLGLGGYALKMAFENQTVNEVNKEVKTDLTKVAGYEPNAKAGDIAVALKNELAGGNTKLIWETGKTLAGTRYDFDGTWNSLGGAVVYNPKDKSLKALEVNILVESFNSYGSDEPAPGGLINTVLGKGQAPPTGYDPWFNIKDHPNAIFTASKFTAKTQGVSTEYKNAPEGWTHLIEGTFKLNGAEEKLAIPAVVAFDGETLTLQTAFEISREVYGVKPKFPQPGSKVDDIVQITAAVKAEPDAGLALEALTQSITDLSEKFTGLKGELKQKDTLINQLTDQVATFERKIKSLEKKLASGAVAAGPAKGTGDSPKAFTAKVQYPGKDPKSFDMVLVPGDEAAGIDAFYIGKHEVTWDLFYDWAYCSDIDVTTAAKLQKQLLRPSPLYEDCEQLKLGLGKRPALSMSRTTAQAFAKWVSEKTGKSYRLPTDKEWQHALKLGGGVPENKDDLLKQAVLSENAEEQNDPPFLFLTGEVGSKAPNKLGIYDMLGNAAEWVTGTGGEKILRGGHFQLEASKTKADWKAVEDQGVWNETYPQLPVSKFWYRDHYYQGFRLVCDVD